MSPQCIVPSSIRHRFLPTRLIRGSTFQFLILGVLQVGCRQSTCSDPSVKRGDLDDSQVESLCSNDTLTFSPNTIDTQDLARDASSGGGTGRTDIRPLLPRAAASTQYRF